jgi:hypothetical protein
MMLLILAALPASAGILETYNSESTFHSALATLTETSFAGVATGSYGCGGVTVGGIKFYGQDFGPGSCWAQIADVTPGEGANWGFRFLRGSNSSEFSYLEILNLPAGTNAVGFNVMTFYKGNNVKIILNGGLDEVILSTSSNTAVATFWGVKTSYNITSVRVATIGGFGQPLIGNFDYGTAQAGSGSPGESEPGEVPELMSLMMMGTGLLALGVRRRQARRA